MPTYGSSLFLDTLADAGLEQYVYQPTCQNNIIDLVFSTHPRLSNLEILPGISDHDATILTSIEVALYHKRDLQSIKGDLSTF